MPVYKRIGPRILDEDGITIETEVRFSNDSKLEIKGGEKGKHFRLKFAGEDIGGWWVDRLALTELITELLYIREEVFNHFGEPIEAQEDEPAHPVIEWKVVHFPVVELKLDKVDDFA